jgi:hypothetical protein
MMSPTSGEQTMTSSTFYFDASALVKRYVAEDGTIWVELLCADEENHALAIAHIGLVEVAAAFATKRRGRYITPAQYERALSDLIDDAWQRYQLISVDQTMVD